jgi:hypothetical protein
LQTEKDHLLPQIILNKVEESGFLCPTVVFQSLTDIAFYVRGERAGAVVVFVVALAGVDINQVVLDGTLHTAWHVVIDRRQFDRHADDLVFAEQGTAFTLHLRIAKVDAGDIEALLGFVTGE